MQQFPTITSTFEFVTPPRLKTIYAIKDRDTGEVKYIGQAQHPQERFYAHLSHPNNDRLKLWMLERINAGRMPELAELEIVPKKDANKREMYYISKHLDTIFNQIIAPPIKLTETQELLSKVLPSLEFRIPTKEDFTSPFDDMPIEYPDTLKEV